jgi:adenylate cyclase
VATIDFEAEGLLAGLEGEPRAARLRLLEALAGDGVPLDELRRAVAEDRLALLPVERELAGGGPRYTAAEIAERSGLPREFLERQWRSLGLALQPDDAEAYTERDLEAAQRIATMREAGLSDEGILDVSRVIGMTMSQLAAANRALSRDAFFRPGDNEYDVAKRFAAAARELAPLLAESLAYVLNVHLREQIRHDAIGASDLSQGRLSEADSASVAFVDMVGFTRLGESLAPDELGTVTGRLGELATEVVEPPVRLVKLIGDAAMLVGPEPRPVLEAVLALVERAEEEGEEFPLLRGGVACGQALPRGGDWYGRPVNIASRVTAIARPGSVLTDPGVHDALEDEYSWSFAGARRLKGIDGEVKLFRCRRARDDA